MSGASASNSMASMYSGDSSTAVSNSTGFKFSACIGISAHLRIVSFIVRRLLIVPSDDLAAPVQVERPLELTVQRGAVSSETCLVVPPGGDRQLPRRFQHGLKMQVKVADGVRGIVWGNAFQQISFGDNRPIGVAPPFTPFAEKDGYGSAAIGWRAGLPTFIYRTICANQISTPIPVPVMSVV